jgi:RNA 3'-terminal phosphate cyclase (ATP)
VLPPLLLSGQASTVVIEGGTHNPMAPPFEFLRDSFCPALARIGATVAVRLDRHGFCPAGGGKLTASIQPLVEPWPLELLERGKLIRRQARALIAHLPAHVASRETEAVKHLLHWSFAECDEAEVHDSDGPGNVLTLSIAHQHAIEVITAFGELRVPAEEVARRAARQARRYLEASAPVGEHLADQLLLPLAVAAGGRFRTLAPSDHAITNAAVIAAFLGDRVAMSGQGDDWLIEVHRGKDAEDGPSGGRS